MHITHPPQLPTYGITRDVRMRFQVGNTGTPGVGVNQDVTFQNLLDTVLVARTTTALSQLFAAVRLNSVEVWSPTQPTASGDQLLLSTTVSVIFDGLTLGAQGDQKIHSDTSMGIQPAHVRARPDPRTQAGQFQAPSGNSAFRLFAPYGAIVDVSMSLRQPVLGNAIAATNAGAALTAGAVYFRGLDGLAASATDIPVVGAPAVA